MDPGNVTHDLDFFLDGVVRTTAELRTENERLKAEKEQLEKRLSEIMPELEMFRKERVALKGAISALLRQSGEIPAYADDRSPGTFETLPHEILQCIFALAVSTEPMYQFDSSVRPGAYNPWFDLLRMKKAFPLICRASVWPGMSVLYGDIVLRRMGQVSALAESLRIPNVGPRLGRFVTSIQWDSCVVAAPCADVVREDLTCIFAQCTQLRSFSYRPHANFPLRSLTPDDDECEGYFNPLWFIMMPSSVPDHPLLQTTLNLRTLDLGDLTMDDAMLQAIHRLLQVPALDALESLTLGPWPMYPTPVLPEDSELMKMSPVSLPSLTDLQIFTTSAAVDQYLCAHWEVPHLARFTILACTGWPEQLLGRFGWRLRYLHLFPTPQIFSNSQVFMPTLEGCSTLADVCPALEHLVLPKLASPPSLLINSPTLVHLDFWRARGQPVRWRRLDQSIATAALHHATRPGNTLPSLRTVRMLYTWGPHDVLSQHGFDLFPFPYYTSTAGTGTGAGARSTRSAGGTTTRSHVRNPDWPWLCHPRLLEEGSEDVLYYRFPQGWVAQTVAALIPQDLGEYRWDLQESLLSEEDWPAVYVHFEELLRAFQKWGESDSGDVAEEVVEEGEGQEGLDDVLRVDGTEGDGIGDGRGNGNGDGDGDGQAKAEGAGDAPISEDVEGRESEELERLAWEEEERREEEKQECAEAAAELTLPEYPVMQLDRETVLAAFRSSRDRESYNHTDIWDNH